MSTPIWDDGPLLASICVTDCDKCRAARVRCVQLCLHPPGRDSSWINICLPCFCLLAYYIGHANGPDARSVRLTTQSGSLDIPVTPDGNLDYMRILTDEDRDCGDADRWDDPTSNDRRRK